MASTNIIFQGALPVFDGKNFDDWRIKMNAIFGFQEVAEVVKTGVQEPGRNATEEQKAKHKELVKLHRKTRILIYQCVEAKIFNNISKAATSKEAQDILVKTYRDGDKNKKVKLQTLRRQYELLAMNDQESIASYFDCMQVLVNGMRACKEVIFDQQMVDKILRTQPPQYDHVAVAIEESKDLDTMEIEDLQHSLEAHEMRINKRRSNEKSQEQALQARSNFKGKGKTH